MVNEWFTEIYGDWYVPTNPTNNGGLIYFFNSLQSDHEIIQPVLQSGNSGYYGGNYWTIASWHWYTDNGGGAYYSPVHSAAAGDYIGGTTYATACVSNGLCDWTIQTYWWHGPGASYTTTMYLEPFGANGVSEKFNRADAGVLETFNMTACNQYPASGSTAFSDTYVYEPNPANLSLSHEVWATSSWSLGHGNAAGLTCGQSVSVFNRTATLHY